METPEQRSRTMRAVKGCDTQPERAVRRLIHGMGFRYRLHRADLPGKPDIVLPSRRKAIFVHGCFWHGHECRRGNRMPKNNREYWSRKIGRNRERDRATQAALAETGWQVAVIWECEIRERAVLVERLTRFLNT
jgi:DNA mismatch endonuclease, patch repair protein